MSRIKKEKNNNGFTIIELITVTVLVGLIMYALLPGLSIVPEAARQIKHSTTYSQEALGFFEYLNPVLKNDCEVISTGDYAISFKSGSDTYSLYIADFPAGPEPYSIVLKKNTGQPYILVKNIALLSSPSRPGLKFDFFNNREVTANSTGNIKSIRATLTFDSAPQYYVFRSAWSLDSPAETLP
ncbi:MAG: type II secretion system protein [bacterium]|nr:type II secretion system protein [bacterium]